MPNTKKYFILSDLHLEFRQGKEKAFWQSFPETQGVNTCICAGDLTVICNPRNHSHFEGLCDRFNKVIYVPGNHEYYGSSPIEADNILSDIEARLSQVLTILRPGIPFEHDGQRFLGDTMWFPDRPEVHVYRKMITDSFRISGMFPWAFDKSNAFMSYLSANVSKDDIVVTHHIPTDVDTSDKWKSSPTQPYFVNTDCQKYLSTSSNVRPKAWIYGHTHDKHDFYWGETRFVCNPLGYPYERRDVLETAPFIYEL